MENVSRVDTEFRYLDIATLLYILVVKNCDTNEVLTNNGNEKDPDIDGETSTGLESGDKV